MSADDERIAREKAAMHVEAAGMARYTRHGYADCLAGLQMLALIEDQSKRDAVTRMCVEAGRVTAYSFSDIVRGVMQAAGMAGL